MELKDNNLPTKSEQLILDKIQKDFYRIKETKDLREIKDINKILKNKKYIAFYGTHLSENLVYNKVIFYSNDNKWTWLKACFLDSYFSTKEQIFSKILPYILQDFLTEPRNRKCQFKQSDEGLIIYDPEYIQKENKYPCLPVVLNKVNPFLSYYLDKYFNNSTNNTIELSIPVKKLIVNNKLDTIKINKVRFTKTDQSIIIEGRYYSPILKHKSTDYLTLGIINTDDKVSMQVCNQMSEIESDIRKVNTAFLDYLIVLGTKCESELSELILNTYPELYNKVKLKYRHSN